MFKRKRRADEEHDEVGKRLDQQEHELEEMARRVRNLEIEAGIIPRFKEVNGE